MLQRLGELLWRDRLDQVQVEPRRPRAGLVFGLTVTGQRDQLNRFAATGADLPGDLVAVEPGQADVDQRDLRSHPGRDADAFRTVGRHVDRVTPEGEQALEHAPRVVVVLD